jgi:hypothetical protein
MVKEEEEEEGGGGGGGGGKKWGGKGWGLGGTVPKIAEVYALLRKRKLTARRDSSIVLTGLAPGNSIQFNYLFHSFHFNSILFYSIQFNSIQFNSIHFNSIQYMI